MSQQLLLLAEAAAAVLHSLACDSADSCMLMLQVTYEMTATSLLHCHGSEKLHEYTAGTIQQISQQLPQAQVRRSHRTKICFKPLLPS